MVDFEYESETKSYKVGVFWVGRNTWEYRPHEKLVDEHCEAWAQDKHIAIGFKPHGQPLADFKKIKIGDRIKFCRPDNTVMFNGVVSAKTTKPLKGGSHAVMLVEAPAIDFRKIDYRNYILHEHDDLLQSTVTGLETEPGSVLLQDILGNYILKYQKQTPVKNRVKILCFIFTLAKVTVLGHTHAVVYTTAQEGNELPVGICYLTAPDVMGVDDWNSLANESYSAFKRNYPTM